MNEKKPLAARLAPQNARLGDLVIEEGMIRFSCPSCGKRLKAPVVKPGAKTRCPKCNQTVDVPSSQRTTAPLAGNSSFSANEAEPPPLPGETKWYYSVNDQKHGPITKRELSELLNLARIAPSSLVWREGYVDWLPANTVKELIPNGNNSPINDGTNPMSINPIRNKRIRTWICFAVIFAGFCFVGWRITRSIEAEDNKWVNKLIGDVQGVRAAAEQKKAKYTREEFRRLVLGMREEKVLKTIGKPNSTQDLGKFAEVTGRLTAWDYEGLTYDPITKKMDFLATVSFTNGIVDNVVFTSF